MIKAICDKCGKEVTLTHSEYGLEIPPGWVIKTAYRPIQADYDYRVFCHDCNPDIIRKAKAKEEEPCAHRQDGICHCPTNSFAPFKCPWTDPDIPKDQKSYFPCPDWEAVE